MVLRDLSPSGVVAALVLVQSWCLPAAAGEVLERVRAAGVVKCGIHPENPALAATDEAGNRTGFEVDLCRTWSAALFGDGGRVAYVEMTGPTELDALSEGRVDVIALHENALFGRRDVTFTAPALVDSLALMVRRGDAVSNALELDGRPVCTSGDREDVGRIEAFAARNGIALPSVASASPRAALERLDEKTCDALLSGRLQLAALRGAAGDAGQYEILPELLSRRLLGPVTASGDRQWSDLIRWSVFALLAAEEKRVNSDNLKEVASSTTDPSIRRLLGFEGELGRQLGVEPLWVYHIIETVGNYREVYARHFGAGRPAALERGPNALWLDGGLLQAPPFQ